MLAIENRSKLEHMVLFTGIAIAVAKCLHNDKLKHVDFITSNGHITATVFILAAALVIKILYHLQFMHFLDKHMRRNQGDKGLFCIILLPLALIFSCINAEDHLSGEYKAVSVVCCQLAMSSIIALILHGYQQKYFLNVFFAIITVTLATSWLQHVCGVYCIRLVCLSVLSNCLFFWLLDKISELFSQSFTIGELNIVCQGIVMFLVSAYFHFIALMYRDETTYISPVNSMIFIALTGLLTVIFLLQAFSILRSTLYFYIVCIGIAGISILVAMGVAFKQNPIFWFSNFIMETRIRIILMIHCAICSCLTFLFITWQQSAFEQSSTVTRKFFHGVAIVIYIPAFVFDSQLLLLASSLIFGIFALLECIRILNIFPLGDIIQNAFCIFLDEKDSGKLMLTHLYLFLGCSVTLWIHPFNSKEMNQVCITSGVLALGFGDSAASIIGTYFGKHKWPHTKKTYEGTLGAFIIQFLGTLYIFFLLNQLPCLFTSLFLLIATASSVLLETFTTQVDNLVLPFYLYTMLVCL